MDSKHAQLGHPRSSEPHALSRRAWVQVHASPHVAHSWASSLLGPGHDFDIYYIIRKSRIVVGNLQLKHSVQNCF